MFSLDLELGNVYLSCHSPPVFPAQKVQQFKVSPDFQRSSCVGVGANALPSLPFSNTRSSRTPGPPPGPPPTHRVLDLRRHQDRKPTWSGNNTSSQETFPKRTRVDASTSIHEFKRPRTSGTANTGAYWRNLLNDQGANKAQFKDFPDEGNWEGHTDDLDDEVMVGSITRRFSSNVGQAMEAEQSQNFGHRQEDVWAGQGNQEAPAGGRWERGGGRAGSGGRVHGFAGLHGKGRTS